MDNKETNIYEDALMDICKKQKLPEMYEKLLDAKFNKIGVNSKYTIYGIAGSNERVLKFNLKKTENFPGDELVSQRLLVSEYSTNGSLEQHFMYGQIVLTHHDDTNAWTGIIHVFDEDNETNRVESIVLVMIL